MSVPSHERQNITSFSEAEASPSSNYRAPSPIVHSFHFFFCGFTIYVLVPSLLCSCACFKSCMLKIMHPSVSSLFPLILMLDDAHRVRSLLCFPACILPLSECWKFSQFLGLLGLLEKLPWLSPHASGEHMHCLAMLGEELRALCEHPTTDYIPSIQCLGSLLLRNGSAGVWGVIVG